MSGDVLLDTNIVIALFARDAAVVAGLHQTPTAIAVQHGLALVTRDAHFREVAGLAVANW